METNSKKLTMSPENQAKTILEVLHQRGERLTIQRRMIVETLCNHPGHIAISVLRQAIQLKGEDFDEATIYRILQWLKELGIVAQTDIGEQETVYEIIYGLPPHHHLICLSCGMSIQLADDFAEQLRTNVQRHYRFEPRLDHMAIFGWCEECQKKHQV